ncbi:MAG: hypothetical protein KF893_11525 [Caldilineaceae bacterium]|nr:hypothetical protein [Caldilineaceae bacterium]
MKTPFSYSLQPPIPALEIRLVNPVTGMRSTYRHALLDTGADVTIIPISLLDQIKAESNFETTVYGLWGGQEAVPIYNIDIVIGAYLLAGILVIGSKESEILLGRNVTNQLRLLLNGPAETVDLLD